MVELIPSEEASCFAAWGRSAGRRSLVVHWDAMNAASASLADRLGFTPESDQQLLRIKWLHMVVNRGRPDGTEQSRFVHCV
jgi:hypothetical protein